MRAKAGGSQSSYDSGGRKARSAGAMLRRYGEQALLEDIRSLMKSWEQLLQSCSLILLSIPKTLRPSVFDREKESVIDRNDPRVRYVSFMTDKPTFETLKEIHSKCAQVLIAEPSVISKPEVSVADNSIESESVPVRAKASKEVQKSTLSNEDAWISCPESVELFDILRQMQAAHGSKEASRTLMDALSRCLSTIQMVYRDDVSDLKEVNTDDIDDDGFTPMTPATLNREMSLDLSVSEVINLPDSLQSISTALHLAADMGDEKVITQLLRMGADPTKRDVRGRAPYILCKTKEARDAFRRYYFSFIKYFMTASFTCSYCIRVIYTAGSGLAVSRATIGQVREFPRLSLQRQRLLNGRKKRRRRNARSKRRPRRRLSSSSIPQWCLA